MNKHREIIYKRRRRLLEQAEAEVRQETVGEPLEEQIKGFLEKEIHALVGKHLSHDFADEELDALVKEFITIIPFDNESQKRLFKDLKNLGNEDDIADRLLKIVDDTYSSRERVLGKDQLRNLEKMVVLSTIDEKWMDHLDEVESLREGIWLRGDKQTVISEYKKEAFGLFEELIDSIDVTIAKRIFRVHPISQPIQPVMPTDIELRKEDIHESIAKEVADATPPSAIKTPQKQAGSLGDLAAALGSAKATPSRKPGSKRAKIGRNDPCPCGSGLKYKKCGLINAPEHKG